MTSFMDNEGYHRVGVSAAERACVERELTVMAADSGGYGPAPVPFALYRAAATGDDERSGSHMVVPKSYGLTRWGAVDDEERRCDALSRDVAFVGGLREAQVRAVDAIHTACLDPLRRGGLLCLQCGEGKTVCAINLVCRLAKKTLIVVHKDFLMQQWEDRLRQFCPGARIGKIKAKTVDVADRDVVIASLQSLCMKTYAPGTFDGFGTLCVDETHHLGAQVFSRALKKVSFPYTVGLTATPDRRDGLAKVVYWHLGEIAYSSVSAADRRRDAANAYICPFEQTVPSCSSSRYGRELLLWNQKPNISKMITCIAEHAPRNRFVCALVATILRTAPTRKVLVLSDRRSQLEHMRAAFAATGVPTGMCCGGATPADIERCRDCSLILATFQYASEGFDMKGLDTLVLATPKSDVTQSVGRIFRDEASARHHVPAIYDVVDAYSVFRGMSAKRRALYRRNKYTCIDYIPC